MNIYFPTVLEFNVKKMTMALHKGKHIVEEIDGIRCTIVEKGTDEKRMQFLKELLELNGYEVKVQKEETAEEESDPKELYTIGVTDLVFNPVIDVYERRLRSKTGHKVTPAYWLQLTSEETEKEVNYWNYGSNKKNKE